MYLFVVTETVDLAVKSFPGDRRGRGLVYMPSLGGAAGLPEVSFGSRAESRGYLRLQPPPNGGITDQTLYAAFSRPLLEQFATFSRQIGRPVVRLLSPSQQARVLSPPRMPIRLGYVCESAAQVFPLDAQLDAAHLETNARIAVINPFGFAFGDSVVVLGALREFHARLEQRLGAIRLDILQHTDNIDTEELYLNCGFIDAVHRLPVPVSLLGEYDAFVDLSVDYPSQGLPWIDELLEMLAIDAATVPIERKRSVVSVRPAVADELAAQIAGVKSSGAPILLFHHRASAAIRSIPDEAVPQLLARVLDHSDWIVVSAIPVPFSHPRLVDWSHLSKSFDHLVYLISQVDAFLCVDTSVYHVAAAVGVPGMVLFSAIDPYFRTTYYQDIHSILLGGRSNRVLGRGSSDDPADLEYAASLWSTLDIEGVVHVLDALMAKRRVHSNG